MWYNTITKELQSNAPWGNAIYSQSIINIMFPNWVFLKNNELNKVIQELSDLTQNTEN